MIPLALRTRLKWARYALLDITDPIRAPRVPPRRKTFIGGGDFVSVGDDFFKTLRRHGLKPTMDVLDVGCGQGRMARPMVGFWQGGSYTGFDISAQGIVWCQEQYRDQSEFTFIHADVYNQRYNPRGEVRAAQYDFPCTDESIDLTFLTSVFTHMFRADIENYLGEIARTLRPGGQALITWFLLRPELASGTDLKMDFWFDVDEVSKTTLRKNPEAAIAFDENYVRQLYAKSGLKIETIEYGHWADPDSSFQFQDMIVARKA